MFTWIIFVALLAMIFAVIKLRELYRREKRLLQHDPKTGALSETGLLYALSDEIKRSQRHLHALTVVYIDLDEFKPVNDVLGYNAGDLVLGVVARTMKGVLRQVDSVARRQGDEFVLLLPETSTDKVVVVLNKLRSNLKETMAANNWPVTFSMGAVTFNNPLDTAEPMIEASANVMHLAKRNGKDRVEHIVFEMREEPKNLACCPNCGNAFAATAHPSCPRCGDAATSQTGLKQTTMTRAGAHRRNADVGGCAFTLRLNKGKTIEFHGPSDITREHVDAVVSAANSLLTGSGGVDGAIHRAGGPAILGECRRIAAQMGRLPVGKAVLTTGANLPAKYIIHAVGPFYTNGTRNEPELLASCYRESVRIAEEHAIKSLAFPSISTGAHGYPVSEAARIAVCTVAEALGSTSHLNQIRFVLFDAPTLRSYVAAGEELSRTKARESARDGLTGSYSRRRFSIDLEQHLHSEQRLSVMLVDIDDFRRVNDTYGHLVGDEVLGKVAQFLSSHSTAYRYGGDEFAAISVCSCRQDALAVADSIRGMLAEMAFEHHPDLRLTTSVGVAFAPEDGQTENELLASVGAAVYKAKREGGNCVAMCEQKDVRTA